MVWRRSRAHPENWRSFEDYVKIVTQKKLLVGFNPLLKNPAQLQKKKIEFYKILNLDKNQKEFTTATGSKTLPKQIQILEEKRNPPKSNNPLQKKKKI